MLGCVPFYQDGVLDFVHASSFSLDVFVQTPIRSTVLHDTSTQLPITEFLLDVSSRTILLIVRARHRHKAILVVSHCLHFLTLLRLALSAVPVLTVTITSALWLHASCCSHRRVSNSMPRLQVSLLMPTCAPHMAYLLKRHLCDPGYVQLSQSRPTASCLYHPCGNTSCALSYNRQEKC